MYGLAGREQRFALVISSSHFTQHVFYRVLPPLIPLLAIAFEYPYWQLGLLISLYALGMGVAQAPLGVLSDRYDRRFILPTGLGLTGGAYVLFGLSSVLGSPIPAFSVADVVIPGPYIIMSLAMLLVGVGLAAVHPTGYPMITDNVAPDNKGKVLGLFGASSKLGDAATPSAIALLILVMSWEWIVVLIGVVGFAYSVLLFLVLGRSEYETVPASRRASGPADEPADTGSVDRREFQYPMVAVFFFFITSMLSTRGLNSFLPAFVVSVYAYTLAVPGLVLGADSIASLYYAAMLVAGAGTQLVLGTLTDRVDPRYVMIGCMIAGTIGVLVLALAPLSPLLLLGVVILLGAGLYGVNPARDALISELSPPAYEGRSFGYIFTATTLISAPLPTAIGYILDVVGMREGFLLLAIGPFLAIGCIAALFSNRIYVDSSGNRSADPAD